MQNHGNHKKILGLSVLSLVVVIVLIGASFAMATGNLNHVSPSNLVDKSNRITTLTSGGGGATPFIGYVNNTLLPWNNTLLRGNVANTGNAVNVIGNPVIDKATGNIYVIISSGLFGSYYLDSINITTNMVTGLILLPVPSGTLGSAGLAYDSSNGFIYVISPTYVYMVNTSLGKYVQKIPDFLQNYGSGYNYDSSVYDSSNGNVYILETNTSGARIDGTRISVLNTSLSSLTSNITSQNMTDPFDGGGPSMVFNASDGYLFVDIYGSNFTGIDIINVTTETLVKSIAVTNLQEGGMLYVPSTNKVYAESYYMTSPYTSAYNLSTVDISSGKLANNITISNGGISSAVFDPVTGYIYVTNYNGTGNSVYNISVIDPASSAVIGHINGLQSTSLVFDATSGYMYSLFGTGGFSIINPSTNSVSSTTIPLGSTPSAIAYDSLGNAYVANTYLNNVFEISHSTGKVSAVIGVGSSPDAIAYDTADKEMFVSGDSGVVSVISTVTNKVVANVTVSGGVLHSTQPALVYDGSNQYVYIINNNGTYSSGSVSVISSSSNSVTGNINVGTDPTSIAYDSSNNEVYVVNSQSNNISVISGTSLKNTFGFGGNSPISIYFDLNTGYLYILWAGNLYTNISVINPSSFSTIKVFNTSQTLTGDVAFNSSGYMYATVWASGLTLYGEVIVVNITSYKVVDSIETGYGTVAIASDPVGNSVDAANYKSSSYYGWSGSISEINFGRETMYNITFAETGLPSGSLWDLIFQNSTTAQGYTSQMSLLHVPAQPNGTYSFYGVTDDSGNYKASPEYGEIVITGYSRTVNITFTPSASSTYTVTFTESGLPSGTAWYVNLSNSQMFSSTSSTISFSEPNGTYFYTIATTDKTYAPSPSSGPLTVNGAPVSETITFSRVTTYTVTFTESGLPSGTTWYLNLSNGQTFSSSSSTLTFSEPNGTYSYTIATSDKTYEPSPSSGSFTVSGAPVAKQIAFFHTYTITFTESGLPIGTSWSVTLNGTPESSTTNAITFSELNGTYSYTIGTADKTYLPSPYSSSFTVNGASVPVSIAFSKVQYTVKFTESGLPSGTTWYVNLSNGIDSGAITGSSYSFSLTNGTYSYMIGNVTGYTVSPSSGSITVSGSNATKTITFTVTSTPSKPSGISSTELYGIIGAVVAVAIIGTALAIMRKRR